MTDPNQLPELPEPAREAEGAGASWRNASPDYFTAEQMQDYALTAIAAERARADALQAEVTSLESALSFAVNTAANAHARADALEAALRELVECKDLKDEIERWVVNEATGEQWPKMQPYERRMAACDEYERRKPAAWATARALLEKKT